MYRTRFNCQKPSEPHDKDTSRLRTVLKEMIRTGMFVDFLVKELGGSRTEAEKEVVCSALDGAKARMRHLQKRMKRLLASEPFRRPGTGFIVAGNQASVFSMRGLQTPA